MNPKIVDYFIQNVFDCQNAQFFLTQMIKMSNRFNILAQKRLPKNVEKSRCNKDTAKMRWQKFLETLDCAKILNHKNMCHSVSTLENKCQKSKEHYIKRKFCLQNIFSKIKIDFVILDQKC